MIIDIDWDDIEAVRKLAQRAKSRALMLDTERKTTSERQAEIFNACMNILETDISHLYDKSNQNRNYYVYAHCDTSKVLLKTKRDGKVAFAATLGLNHFPFYIGKGTGSRAYDVNRNETHRKIKQRLNTHGKDVEVSIVKSNLTSSEAFALESKLIDIFGVIGKGGKLTNLDEGKNSQSRRLLYLNDLKIVNPYHIL